MRFSWISDFCLHLLIGRTFNRFLLFSGVLVFTGCAGVFFNGCNITSTTTVICLDTMEKQGQKAYLNGDYTLARQIFSQLALRESDAQLQAAGFYGNVCLDMILAEDAPAFRKAVAKLWFLPSHLSCRISTARGQRSDDRETRHNIWSGIHPEMLMRALAHGMVLLESERSGILENLKALDARQDVYKKERFSMQKKMDSLGLKIKSLEKQNMGQAARISDLSQQITDLLHQITVLEKIDKERQEQRENQ